MKHIIAIVDKYGLVSNKLYHPGDQVAKVLIESNRARLATEEEIKAGKGLPKEEKPKPASRKKADPKPETVDASDEPKTE